MFDSFLLRLSCKSEHKNFVVVLFVKFEISLLLTNTQTQLTSDQITAVKCN